MENVVARSRLPSAQTPDIPPDLPARHVVVCVGQASTRVLRRVLAGASKSQSVSHQSSARLRLILALFLSWRAACLSRCVSFPIACSISTDYLQASAPPTLQESQTHALLTLLNLNNTVESSSGSSQSAAKGASLKVAAPSGPPVWKVLVLDQYTKDVLATVLRVQDLRDVGVTLHVWVPKRLVL